MAVDTDKPTGPRIDICTLEADLAFFEARLSLANDAPDTAYQRAQTRAYRALGVHLNQALSQIRATKDTANGGKTSSAAA